ncbi:hypothetical protein ATK36_2857 [Amycolatopsis sulphurea]|uniref:DUF5667 domain-containing protein n=1 Tax=Amycolatopsis sulphurea TaxID=76022 RepID=A0A2A9FA25_9PSEU|nr:DUF5667 domain-containing protein [Amycolatopsis sulphurea]PFG47803.1 hypothetical protein ATK36_2857 [Amycolatopsis sulphurea]
MGVPGRFSRERAENERFDRALGTAAQRPGDEFADELALVGELRELGAAGAPDPPTRARIRAEIEGRLGNPLPRRRRRPRVAELVAAGIVVLLGLAGLTLLLSRDALPGDTLYQLKRAGEATALGLTFDQAGKAGKHLEFAADRLAELARLSDASPTVYQSVLTDFGSHVQAGTREITALATQRSDEPRLAELASWAQAESRQLAIEQARAPAAAQKDFAGAHGLLAQVRERTTALGSRLSCYLITTGRTDELGLLPATGPCTPQPEPSGGPALGSLAPVPLAPRTSAAPAPTAPAKPDLAVTSPPAPSTGSVPSRPPHSAVPPPITAPTSPRIPAPATTRPPVVSIPPLLPGLPPIVIG